MASGEWAVARVLAALGCVVLATSAGASGTIRVIHESDKLLAATGAASDNAGVSVELEGVIALVGAPLADMEATNGGGVFVFDAGTGLETGTIAPEGLDSQDFFGGSLAIDAGLAVIGAPGDDDVANGAGAAYVFDMMTGEELSKLHPGSGQAGGLFGTTVAIDDDIVVIGAPFETPHGLGSGAAYVFEAQTGIQIARLVPDDGAAFDQFGSAVSISGATVLVGAPNAAGSGAVYVFDVATGAQLDTLVPNDGAAGDQFGASVSLEGPNAAIGATNNAGSGVASGSVYLFNALTGTQLAKTHAPDAEAGDAFGWSVGFCGGRLLVSAFNDDDNGPGSGSAYAVTLATGLTVKLLPGDGEAGDAFGAVVSCDDDRVLVGAFGDDDNGENAGAAYLFGLPCNSADFDAPFGVLDLADIVAFVVAFQGREPYADLDNSGVFDLDDLVVFITALGAGCD